MPAPSVPEMVSLDGGTASWPGLDDEEAAARLAADGPNVLPQPPEPTVAARVVRQLLEPLTLVLVVVAGITLAVLRQIPEGVAIAAIVVLNVAIGVSQEGRAQAAIHELDALTAPEARVVREGRSVSIPASQIVRGDVVELAAGDRVPADLLLAESASLAIDEAMLTGEAMPAAKQAGYRAGPGDALGDRAGEAFAGTLVVRGRGRGEVRATGARTEIGAIAAVLGHETAPPLVEELAVVAQVTSVVAVSLGALLTATVLIRGGGLAEALVAGVALAVAAVPEGMATVVTTALALGARRMAERGAMVRRLPAMEALGAATVLCTDKTGTLTTGRLAVAELVAVPGRQADLWDAALRCNDAADSVGDPIDVALVEAARARGHPVPAGNRTAERPFDALTRSMTTVHRTMDGPVLSLKGAPEAVLARCRPGTDRDRLEAAVAGLAREGLRVLAVASSPTDDLDAAGLDPLGLIGFTDPLRPAARETVRECRRAGIRLVLVTGDHLSTARAIAAEAGLEAGPAVTGSDLAALAPADRDEVVRRAAILARVDPGDKVALVRAHRAAGEIVAMTGDGVNDAPALREADIGVAFAGTSGTDVAREAAALVVTDGDLAIVAAAVAEGRRIWSNLVSVISYLVAGNVSEILVVLGCIVLLPDLAVPLLPVQLLWVNFVTDGLPAVALGVDRRAGDPLAAPPRPRSEHLLGRRRQLALAARAAVVAGAVVATGVIGLASGWRHEAVRTQLLLSLLAAHLVLAYVSRAQRLTFERGWAANRTLLAAVAGSLALQGLAFGTRPGRSLLGLTALPPVGWLLAGAAVLFSVTAIDAGRWWRERRR